MRLTLALVLVLGAGIARAQELRSKDLKDAWELRVGGLRLEVRVANLGISWRSGNGWWSVENDDADSSIEGRYWAGFSTQVGGSEAVAVVAIPDPKSPILIRFPRQDRICVHYEYQDFDSEDYLTLKACRPSRGAGKRKVKLFLEDPARPYPLMVGTATWDQELTQVAQADTRHYDAQGKVTRIDRIDFLAPRFDEAFGAATATRPMRVEVYRLVPIDASLPASKQPWYVAYREDGREYSRELIARWSNLFVLSDEDPGVDPAERTYSLPVQRAVLRAPEDPGLQVVVSYATPDDPEAMPWTELGTVVNAELAIAARGADAGSRRTYQKEGVPFWMVYRDAWVYPRLTKVALQMAEHDAAYQRLYDAYFALSNEENPANEERLGKMREELEAMFERGMRLWDLQVKLILRRYEE